MYDQDGNDVLDKAEAKDAVKYVIDRVKGPGTFNQRNFEEWFKEFDVDGNGTIDRAEMASFVKKVGNFGKHFDPAVHKKPGQAIPPLPLNK